MKKILLPLLFLMILLLAAVPALADDPAEPADPAAAYDWSSIRILEQSPAADEEMTAATVQARGGNQIVVNKNYTYTAPDDWSAGFAQPVNVFDLELARTALALDASANYTLGQARASMTNLGFTATTHITTREYGYATGRLTLTRDDGSRMHILAVVLRGSTIAEEWDSSLAIGKSGDAAGYADFADIVLDGIDDKITSLQTAAAKNNEPWLVWISGFGRGGAAANLLAHELNETCGVQHVLCYTFAAPQPTVNSTTGGLMNCNIFNIVNAEDGVCLFPFNAGQLGLRGSSYADWGFRRYGNDLILQNSATLPRNSAQLDKAKSLTRTYSGADFYDYGDGGAAVREMCADIVDLTPNRSDFLTGKKKIYSLTEWTDDVLQSAGMYAMGLGGTSAFTTAHYTTADFLASVLSIIYRDRSVTNDMKCMLVGTALYKTSGGEASVKQADLTPIILYLVQHGAHINLNNENARALLNLYQSGTLGFNSIIYELTVQHKPEVYLAWLNSADTVGEVFSNGLAVSAGDGASDGDVSVSMPGAFYEDMQFNVSKFQPNLYADDTGMLAAATNLCGYDLRLTVNNDLPAAMLRTAAVSLPLPENTNAASLIVVRLTADGQIAERITDFRVAEKHNHVIFATDTMGQFVVGRYVVDQAPTVTALSSDDSTVQLEVRAGNAGTVDKRLIIVGYQEEDGANRLVAVQSAELPADSMLVKPLILRSATQAAISRIELFEIYADNWSAIDVPTPIL